MTRSLEAIKLRAEKRGRSINEQKAVDWAAVKAEESKKYPEQVNTSTTKSNPATTTTAATTTAAAAIARDIPTKPAYAPAKTTSSTYSIARVCAGAKTGGGTGAWDCPKCSNSNRPERKECFRCRTDKPAANMGRAVVEAVSKQTAGVCMCGGKDKRSCDQRRIEKPL
jgi:hypothetical protein